MLFIPADADRFIAKASTRGADAIVLDLEDGVAPAAKDAARSRLQASVSMLRGAGSRVYVRVNPSPGLLAEDARAAVAAGAQAVLLPKLESLEQLNFLDDCLSRAEQDVEASQPTAVLAILETPLGIARAFELANGSTRLRALCLGSEDLATSMDASPSPELLTWSAQAMVIAAVSAGLEPLGLVGSVADYRMLNEYRALAQCSRRIGLRGAICIHPDQVATLNDVFGDSPEEVAHALRVVQAFEAAIAQGLGACSVDGRMVDEPIAARARHLLQRHAASTSGHFPPSNFKSAPHE